MSTATKTKPRDDAFAAHRKATRAALDAVEEARLAVLRLRDQRAEIEAAAVPKADALAALDAGLDALAAQAERSLSVTSLTRPAGRPSLSLNPAPSDLAPLLVAVGRKELRRIMAAKVEEAYGTDAPTLTRAQREQRLAELDGHLLDAETHEELLVREAEAVGLSVLRRADADPRAVLAKLGAGQ
jgi:hypothetical protein